MSEVVKIEKQDGFLSKCSLLGPIFIDRNTCNPQSQHMRYTIISPSSKMNTARKLEKRKYWNCINVLVRISWLSFIKRTNYMASTTCYSFIASSIHLRSSKPPTHMRRGKLKVVKGMSPCWSWTHSQMHLAPEPRLCPTLPGGVRRREEAKWKMAVIYFLCQPHL